MEEDLSNEDENGNLENSESVLKSPESPQENFNSDMENSESCSNWPIWQLSSMEFIRKTNA